MNQKRGSYAAIMIMTGLLIVVGTASPRAGSNDEDIIFQDAFETAPPGVDPVADLSLAKTASATQVELEQPFQYVLSISNLGPDAATDVVLSDSLPAGVAFVGLNADAPLSCQHHAGSVSCTAAVLPVGQFVLTIDVLAPAITGPVTNQAVLTASSIDPTPPGMASAVVEIVEEIDPPGNQPEVLPGPIQPGQISPIWDTARDWVTGPDAPQIGVAEDALDPKRIALITGRVLDRAGAPISGVLVRLLNAPELGHTLTDANGFYTFAFNGGGSVALDFQAPGLLRVQRRFASVWNEWGRLDDVVMIGVDIESQTGSPVPGEGHLHEASTEVDANGSRTGRLYLRPGTELSARLEDGTVVPLTGSLDISVTEYTVGETGPQAMPGVLPDSSGYTYAAEVRVAQAEDLGAARVELSIPAVKYLDDFLGFGAGAPVPVGVFDRQLAAWAASENGLVIGILAVNNGQAVIDLSGDGVAATPAELDAFGIDLGERELLGGLVNAQYGGGPVDLWRAELPHFSPWDLNWPLGPNPDATRPPSVPSDRPGDTSTPDPNPPTGEGFGRIVIETQSLTESVPLAGTTFSLVHSSRRQPGRVAIVDVPVIEGPVPVDLLSARVDLMVAGQRISREFNAAELSADLRAELAWDGRDVFGRALNGAQPAVVTVIYRYPGRFAFGPPGRSFGLPAVEEPAFFVSARRPAELRTQTRVRLDAGGIEASGIGLGGWTLDAHHTYDLVAGVLERGDGEVRRVPPTASTVQFVAGCDLTASACGQDNSAAQTLLARAQVLAVAPDGAVYVGVDGTRWAASRILRIDPRSGVVTPFAGVPGTGTSGCTPQALGDGGPALEACMRVTEIRFAPDGAVLLADSENARIRRVDPETGIITTVVGNGSFCSGTNPCGDGGAADQAGLNSPIRFGIAADGTIFLAHDDGNRLRRVGPDGIIHTILGVMAPGWTDDCSLDVPMSDPSSGGRGGVDLEAIRRCPSIQNTSLAVTAEAAVMWMVSDDNDQRRGLVELSPAGELRVRAGFAANFIPNPLAPNGDGGPAIGAPMTFGSPVLMPDGSILLGAVQGQASDFHYRVRRISSDGLIHSVIGYGGTSSAVQIGATALNQPLLQGYAMPAAGPDGAIYLLVRLAGGQPLDRRSRIVRIDPPLPGLGIDDSELQIADESGRFVDVFDQRGRHLRVVSALTGQTLRRFSYDDEGRLSAVIDHTGPDTELVTEIERDADGQPSAIIGPYGHRTELSVDANGYLATITDPDGGSTLITSTAGGLITAISGPRTVADPPVDTTYVFSYDASGRLLSATDPLGQVTSLSRTVSTDGSTSILTGPDGLSRQVSIQSLTGGAFRRTTVDELGNTTVQEELVDGRHRRTDADGTVTTWRMGPDPRFGMSAPIVQSLQVQSPAAGRPPMIMASQRSASLAGNGSLISQTETATIGTAPGRTTTAVYDAATRTWTVTSPEGRVSTQTLDPWARPSALDLPGFAPVTWTRDALGRLIEQQEGTGPDARISSYAYDDGPYILSWTDPENRTTSYTRNAHGQILSATRPDLEVEAVSRDAHGNLAEVIAPDEVLEKTHTLVHDGRDDLVQHQDPDDGISSFGRDARGMIDAVTRADASSFAMQRTAWRLDAISGADVLDMSWSYTGPRLTAATAEALLALDWDGPLLLSETWTDLFGAGDGTATVSHAYDNDFRRISETLAGSPLTRSYDRDDRLIQVGAQTIRRNPATGFVTARTLDQATVAYSYDEFGAVATISASHGVTGSLYQVTIDRDALGRITQRIETVDGQTTTWTYAYDPAGRLSEVRETPDGGAMLVRSYVYDANGNLVSGPAGNAQTTAGDRMLGYGNRSITHNAAGDLVSISEGGNDTLFDYDAGGLLRGIVLADNTEITHRHDALDRRVARLINGAVDAGWVYGPGPSPIAQLDADGNLQTRFVYGLRSATPDYLVHDGIEHIVIWDERGTPRLVVDASTGIIVERLDVDELGAAISDLNQWTLLPIGFSGGFLEPHTGLVRFGARDYDPSLGRFTTRDPILFDGGQSNLYLYAAGDPVNRQDPSGMGPSTPRGPRVGNVLDGSGELVVDGRGYPLGPGDPIHLGDQIRSGSDGAVTLEFALGGRAVISPSTTVDVATSRGVEVSGNAVERFRAKAGAFWSSVDGQKQQLQIQTSGGVIGIEG